MCRFGGDLHLPECTDFRFAGTGTCIGILIEKLKTD